MDAMSDESARAQGAGVQTTDDPTEKSLWRPVHTLLSDMDHEIARVYAERGIEDLKPTWVLEILRLQARGPMTIAELARSVGRTHSALSQKVAAMRAAGWVDTSPGRDARSKTVTLTPKAERAAALLTAEWRATEAALAELEAELPYPLTKVTEDIRSALSRRPFHTRIAAHLAAEEGGASRDRPLSLFAFLPGERVDEDGSVGSGEAAKVVGVCGLNYAAASFHRHRHRVGIREQRRTGAGIAKQRPYEAGEIAVGVPQ